jgi:NAD(P)H-flavin reductase
MSSVPMSLPELPYVPHAARIVERVEEAPGIFTLRLAFADADVHAAYQFLPGQFNMLYLHGAGEIPISIVSDPEDEHLYDHTVRVVGRVTKGLARLKADDVIGVRGPFGRGWPLQAAQDKDVVLITGGLGCAPLVSVINYVVRRREQYRRLVIMQGVKHAADLFWKDRYDHWAALADTQVILAASRGGQGWPFATGYITSQLDEARFDPGNCVAMLCGPEGMMKAAIENLTSKGVTDSAIWLSTERNMQCAIGQCGHCQIGPYFVCKDGPVFCYSQLKPLFGVKGF